MIQDLRERGYRITVARKLLADLFQKTQKPLNAYGIKSALNKSGKKIDLVSIYRNLEMFEKEKLVHQTSLGYVACRALQCENVKHCHHHFICQHCEKVSELHLQDQNFLAKLSKQFPQLKFSQHYFEFQGLCSNCQ